MARIVLHVDFDYFYAQVEEVARNAQGRPIVVCMYSGRTSTSGAVATANYDARKYGVKAGIPIFEAKSKLRSVDALFLPADHALYAEKSLAIMQLLSRYADALEPASIDEAFLDISKKCKNYDEAKALAAKIKKEIKEKLGLTCSIGIAPNKLVAKIASDFQKPDGLTVVVPEKAQAFLDPLDVKDIPGIGPKTREFLAAKGISTVADLRRSDRGWMVEAFGKKTGAWLTAAAHGRDDSPVHAPEGQKQLSRIKTLKHNSRDLQEITNALDDLIADLACEIDQEQLAFSVVGIHAVDADLHMHSKSKTLPHPSHELGDIQKTARGLFGELLAHSDIDFRRVGVRVERLQSRKGQKTLGEF